MLTPEKVAHRACPPQQAVSGSFCGSYALVFACFASCDALLVFPRGREGSVHLGMFPPGCEDSLLMTDSRLAPGVPVQMCLLHPRQHSSLCIPHGLCGSVRCAHPPPTNPVTVSCERVLLVFSAHTFQQHSHSQTGHCSTLPSPCSVACRVSQFCLSKILKFVKNRPPIRRNSF